jgi:XTP/dITP diphosphohydrolase
MQKLVIATGNAHKTAEFRAFLGDRFLVSDLSAVPAHELPVENGDSFTANALIKARAAARRFPGCHVLADDSGLEVDTLGGAPGIFSARYAGANATDADNRRLLLRRLAADHADQHPWAARFRCVLVWCHPDAEEPLVFDGSCEGEILDHESGDGGFGYDPVFRPEGYPETFGTLGEELKNAISHRATAMQKLLAYLASDDANVT